MVLSSCASCSVSCACGDECWHVGITGECWHVGITGECWHVGITGECWHVGINELCLLLSSSSDQYMCMDTASFVVVVICLFFSFLYCFFFVVVVICLFF